MASSDSDSTDSLHYSILSEPVTAEIKVKGSRFIAHAAPVQNMEQCEDLIAQWQKTYHDATHVCYAFRVGISSQPVYRYTDAGEPAGTAGAPILQVINGYGLTNIVVAVIRYFGGTKLGIGGLIRAYTDVTKTVLVKAHVEKKQVTAKLHIRINYDQVNSVMRELSAWQAQIEKQDYSERVELTVSIIKNRINPLRQNLINATSGKIEFIDEEDSQLK